MSKRPVRKVICNCSKREDRKRLKASDYPSEMKIFEIQYEIKKRIKSIIMQIKKKMWDESAM